MYHSKSLVETNSTYKNSLDLHLPVELNNNCDYLDPDWVQNLGVETSDLSVIELNIRGLINKVSFLNFLLSDCLRDKTAYAILLCETWLNITNFDLVNIPSYILFSNVRSGKLSRGTDIMVHQNLRCRQRRDLELKTKIFEHTVVELKNDTTNILLASGYRPPNSNAKLFLGEYKTL